MTEFGSHEYLAHLLCQLRIGLESIAQITHHADQSTILSLAFHIDRERADRCRSGLFDHLEELTECIPTILL